MGARRGERRASHRPWVCLGLKVLVLKTLQWSESAERNRRILDQLSRLKELDYFSLFNSVCPSSTLVKQEDDLTLDWKRGQFNTSQLQEDPDMHWE